MTHIQEFQESPQAKKVAPARWPRLGFVGVGWIGRHRMQAVADSDLAEIAAVADCSPDALSAASEVVPEAALSESLSDLLSEDLDGIVIATPNALHAEQTVAALDSGRSVFCQKPLARTLAETREIVDAARRADRRLDVDLSYRFVRGVPQMRELIQSGELGDVYAADLTFHNAYGPDKDWFYDAELSGGGCVADLGTHLVDLALWMFDFPEFDNVTSRLFRQGRCMRNSGRQVEDYALASWDFQNGATVRLSCSWNLSAGREAVIEAAFYGTRGAVALRNVNGSFFDFVVEWMTGTSRRVLASPPDPWGGRAVLHWTGRLAECSAFDPEAERLGDLSALLDAIYERRS